MFSVEQDSTSTNEASGIKMICTAYFKCKDCGYVILNPERAVESW